MEKLRELFPDVLVEIKKGVLYFDGKPQRAAETAILLEKITDYENIKPHEVAGILNKLQDLPTEEEILERIENQVGEITISSDGAMILVNDTAATEIDILVLASLSKDMLNSSYDRAVETTVDFIKLQCAVQGKVQKSELDAFKEPTDENAIYTDCINSAAKILTKIYKPIDEMQSYDVATTMAGGIAKAICNDDDFDFFNPQRAIAIVGYPGIGKTTQITALYGKTAYTSNNFNFSYENEGREAIKLADKLAYICDDMVQSYTELETMKAFVSAKYHTYRPCMANYSTRRRNTATLIFTSNDREILSNQPGVNRRLVVIESTLKTYNPEVTVDDIDHLRAFLVNAANAQIKNRIKTPSRKSNVERYITDNPEETLDVMGANVWTDGTPTTLRNAIATSSYIDIQRFLKMIPKPYEFANARRLKRQIKGEPEFGKTLEQETQDVLIEKEKKAFDELMDFLEWSNEL